MTEPEALTLFALPQEWTTEVSTTSGCVARHRRYSSVNSSESGSPLSSSMA
jgi:hypothetical protein